MPCFQITLYLNQEFRRPGDQLFRILNGAEIEVLIVAAIADQGSIENQLAVIPWEGFPFSDSFA